MIVLKLEARNGNPRNSEGSFVTLKDGRIMFIYSRFYGGEWNDNGRADLVARYSSDGGKSWSSEDRLIVRNTCAENVMSASLLRLHSGRLALVYLEKESFLLCLPVIRFSDDEGEHWSEPRLCVDTPGYYVVNNDRIIQLKNGRLIIPVAQQKNINPTTFNPIADIMFYYSDDEGSTWKKSSLLPPPEDKPEVVVEEQIIAGKISKQIKPLEDKHDVVMQEPGVIELNDGTLWSWVRTEMGCQYMSVSRDSGETWTAATASAFCSPCSPMSMKRNAKGELIAVWNDISPRWQLGEATEESWGRTPLVLAKSQDDGKTWDSFELIEADPSKGYCYTAIHFIGDQVLLSYCCGGGGKSIVLQDTHLKLMMN